MISIHVLTGVVFF